MLPVLVTASGAGSSAAILAQAFTRDARVAADIVLAGGNALPAGTWREAWLAGELTVSGALDVIGAQIDEDEYQLLLFDETPLGRAAAARLAVRRSLPLIAQAVGLRLGRDGLRVTRSADGGAKTAVIAPFRTPVIVVVSVTVGGSSGGEGIAGETTVLDARSRAPVLDLICESRLRPGEMDLADADVVVAGGRGMGGREGFEMLEELAELLGGTVGASRVAVDAGWVPYRRQVGLTGKTVAPRLYLACGISGAPHHVLGMRSSSLIVAINSDPQAPIFRLAHVTVVGQVEQVIPQLISELRQRKAVRSAEARGVSV